MHSLMNKAITFAILVLFLVQVSVAAVSSCSPMMMSSALSSQVTNDNTHQMMDHSQHAMMFSSADNIGDSSKGNSSSHENMQDDCCDESCICEIASCSYSNLMNHSTGFIFTNQAQQTKILFIASAHQAQYLNYLFKPPIRSIA
jgi:hypothetical protein